MVEKSCSTLESETSTASLHQWLPRQDGLVWVGLAITKLEVARLPDGGVVLALLRSAAVQERVVLDSAAAKHLAACILGTPAKVA
jgi:hypothetical protein